MQRLNALNTNLTRGQSKKNSLTVKDNRTGKTYEFPIDENSFIRSSDLGKIVHQGKMLRYYDPGYKNTMNCTSRITYIDGAKGNNLHLYYIFL